jgi:triosephosphate isomerase
MNRKKSVLLAGNWKMNHGPQGTREFFQAFRASPKPNATLRFYTPFVSLDAAIQSTKESGITAQIGAQNLHAEKSGAFTGEVSGPMLRELGVEQVLIGHSERRQYFGETDEILLKKTQSALAQGFEVLFCIGELLSEREGGMTQGVLLGQLTRILQDPTCKEAFGSKLHLAYEPIWAIGTGVVATPEQAQTTHAFIRKLLSEKLGNDRAQSTKILYGGSVTPANFKALLACEDIDGGLVGGASLKPDSFQALWELIDF